MPEVRLSLVSTLRTLASSKRRDNSWLAAKNAVRAWALSEYGRPIDSAYEVYGSGGASTIWLKAARISRVDGCQGDAIQSLNDLTHWGYQWWDVDPYGNCWEALSIIGTRATANRIAVFACDGAMTKAAKLHFRWPTVVRDATGWDEEDRWRKAWVWYNYPTAFAQVIQAVTGPRWSLVASRSAPLGNRTGTVVRYSAAVLARVS